MIPDCHGQDTDIVTFRTELCAADIVNVQRLVSSSGIFYDSEVKVAIELAQECLDKGPESGYNFLLAEKEGDLVGYTSYGEISLTEGCYDLYWIAVQHQCRGHGIGSILLKKTEDILQSLGARRIYIETSSREPYEGTRAFYKKADYKLEALIKHFYAPNDHKCLYVKAFDGL